ncbi:unnamed protein product [Prorocentrum cordatum]|uniref:Conserved oligomeric Golgi complex subunit 2 n=1 Tax=Prorocentrum cordatum TaxID=2364126 RepID=A0ABN9R7A9_9DINO|nr:unnamed protein product [Polarella glacialis]
MEEIPASEFDGRDFDAREVVQRYRKRVPLPQLQKGLRAHHAATRQELVELINEKYADFVSLSSQMQGVERALKPLRVPLEESSDLMQGLRSKLRSILGQADEAHESLAQVRARKDALVAYIENARILDRAKAQAARGGGRERRDALSEHASLENVARDLRRIRLNLGGEARAAGAGSGSPAASGPGGEAPAAAALGRPPPPALGASPECQALLREAADFEEQFAGQVRERLLGLAVAARRRWDAAGGGAEATPGSAPALARGELLAVAHLCRALVAVGRAGAAEEVFAQVFTEEVLDRATSECTAAAEEIQRRSSLGDAGTSPGGSLTLAIGAGAVDLGPFFAAVGAALLGEDTPVVWLARQLGGGAGPCEEGAEAQSSLLAVPSLALVANAVATPALQHVQRVWPNTFMPAFPDVFAANYAQSALFLKAAEARMSAAERSAFRQGAALRDFQRRWKTQVYSSLRKKETEQRLEAAAAASRVPQAGPPAAAPAHSAAGRGFWVRASGELAGSLEMLWSDRWYLEMVQTSLELLARYARIVQSLVDGVRGDEGGWDAAASPPAWSPSSVPVHLARVASDVFAVIAELRCARGAPGAEAEGRWARMVLARAPPGSGRPREVVGELLGQAVQGLGAPLEALQEVVVRHVAAAAAPEFAAIRGIPAFYRMLDKPVPRKATPYVESAMRPIQALREAAGEVAPAEVVAEWTRQAVDGAAAEFATQAAQLLESTRQQEASLRRLGNRGAGGESQVSDLDKIHIQLALDASAFAAAAAGLGAAPEGCHGLRRLQEVVEPLRALFEAHRPVDA